MVSDVIRSAIGRPACVVYRSVHSLMNFGLWKAQTQGLRYQHRTIIHSESWIESRICTWRQVHAKGVIVVSHIFADGIKYAFAVFLYVQILFALSKPSNDNRVVQYGSHCRVGFYLGPLLSPRLAKSDVHLRVVTVVLPLHWVNISTMCTWTGFRVLILSIVHQGPSKGSLQLVDIIWRSLFKRHTGWLRVSVHSTFQRLCRSERKQPNSMIYFAFATRLCFRANHVLDVALWHIL